MSLNDTPFCIEILQVMILIFTIIFLLNFFGIGNQRINQYDNISDRYNSSHGCRYPYNGPLGKLTAYTSLTVYWAEHTPKYLTFGEKTVSSLLF